MGDRQLLGAACLIAAVYIVIVFAIGASRAGTWVARTLVAPVFGLRAQDAVRVDAVLPSAAAPEQAQTARIELPAFTCYALQMGVYASEANAVSQAQHLQGLGAGGYIQADGARFRVLAAAYADRESFDKVKAQLAAEGLDSTLRALEGSACSLSISASAGEVRAYQEAMAHIASIQRELTEQAIEFDRQRTPAEAGLSELLAIRDALTERQSAFAGSLSAPTAVSEAVLRFYRTLGLCLSDMEAAPSPSRSEVASAFKYAGLLAAELLIGVYQAVEGA